MALRAFNTDRNILSQINKASNFGLLQASSSYVLVILDMMICLNRLEEMYVSSAQLVSHQESRAC